LEFPEVFEVGGFDCVLGNPPWERIQVEEQSFFTNRDQQIASATGVKRKEYIRKLKETKPDLYNEFEKHRKDVEAIDKFIKTASRYPLTGSGKMNTYAIFSELCYSILSDWGAYGIVIPLGIATDDNNKDLFSTLIKDENIISIYGFENEEFIFTEVHHAFKFVALSVSKNKNIKSGYTDFSFFNRNFFDLNNPLHHYHLNVSDIFGVNPNTGTAPIFRTKIDAEINKRLYKYFPVINNHKLENNCWYTSIHRMLNPTDDSHLFKLKEELEANGFKLIGNSYTTHIPHPSCHKSMSTN
jgi:hypothetical protein